MLSPEELARYNRHLILPEVGTEGQERLKAAKVLVIGAGGLGCPILQYLTAAGVGTIGVIDDDTVDESNLQRQVLFTIEEIGLLKVESAIDRLRNYNPFVKFIPHPYRLTNENALDLFGDYDVIIDGSDNFPTRYLVNDACIITGKPLVFGSIFKFEGQVSVFNYQNGPTYRCLFPEPPSSTDVPNCAEIGVLGVLPGIIGCLQANEAIKIITGLGDPLSGRLLAFDALAMSFNTLRFTKNEDNSSITELSDYQAFCNVPENNTSGINSITPSELKTMLDNNEKLLLIDVREPFEYDICKLGAQLIPLNTIMEKADSIPKDIPVIVYCHHGMRSASAIDMLQSEYGFTNLINLSGGIHQWAIDVDPEMDTY